MADRTRRSDEIVVEDDARFQHASFGRASWVENYQKKPFLQKVFDESTWTQDHTLRVLQGRIVLGANIWALIITIILTVVFAALPKGNYF